jgi:hypothetical protein
MVKGKEGGREGGREGSREGGGGPGEFNQVRSWG